MIENQNLVDFSAKPDIYFTQLRPEMHAFIPLNAARVLDIGCGEGLFGRQLKEKSEIEVWGVEIEPMIAEKARRHLDKVFCGDVLQQLEHLPDAYFDCVICNDVIEHLADPYSMLLAIKKKLAPDGVVVCSIPNIRHFPFLYRLVVRGEWTYADSGVLDKTHLRFFTKKSILETFEALGYRVLRIEGINPTPSWRVALFNIATMKFFDDTRYLQFACVAAPRRDEP